MEIFQRDVDVLVCSMHAHDCAHVHRVLNKQYSNTRSMCASGSGGGDPSILVGVHLRDLGFTVGFCSSRDRALLPHFPVGNPQLITRQQPTATGVSYHTRLDRSGFRV